jgi:DNA-directed RNA polymerase specialized sigma24 family protein
MARSAHTWELTRGALTALLARLDADEEEAARKFQELARALRKFFAWQGDEEPEAGADEVLDRLARKLEAGETIADLATFARGIARLVRHERRRRAAREPLSTGELPDLADRPAPRSAVADDRLPSCLDQCLDKLPADERALVIAYYAGERSARIVARARLAAERGLTDNALRHRVQRLRERLKACAERCAGKQGNVSLAFDSTTSEDGRARSTE